ncbi:hypothetical protein [Streptosporangium sp. NPDC023615]|uniref:hypothetical protein n=1 Tax=Streptosporangium sp. NPDC023615 TaxID=3154794 RepID=UPI003445DC19
MQHHDTSSRVRESRAAGRELAHAFGRGVRPQAVDARMVLDRDEFCVGQVPAVVLLLTDAEAEYVRKSGGYVLGGSPAGLVLGSMFSAARFTSNVVGNRMRKARAAREAAPQWRPADEGTLYLTNRRFAVQGRLQWHDLWFEHIRMSDCDGLTIRLELSGSPSTMLEVPHPDYWFVMFNKLAYDKVVVPPGPDAPA